MEELDGKGRAVAVCTTMAFGYVALLYAPDLCLSRPKSFEQHLLRRFASATVASILAPVACLTLLPGVDTAALDTVTLLKMFGLSNTRLWRVTVLPVTLTSLIYLGPLLLCLIDFSSWCIDSVIKSRHSAEVMRYMWRTAVNHGKSLLSDILWWRNFLMAPISEEVVFRVCMVPVLLCGGFSALEVVFICPMFFALAHVHHFWDLVYGQRQPVSTAFLIIGMQLGYTTLFGWYATFLYLRTASLLPPLMAHMFCNTMGLPDIRAAWASQYYRGILVAYVLGLLGFVLMLGPMSDPYFYNEIHAARECACWQGYCKWDMHGASGTSHVG